MEKISDRDYKQARLETLRLMQKNVKTLNDAKNKIPVIKDLTPKVIQTNFLSKQDTQYKNKHIKYERTTYL